MYIKYTSQEFFEQRRIGTKDAALLRHDSHDVFFAHDQELVAVNAHGCARIFAEQDLVADFDVNRENFTFVVLLARSNGQYLP